MRTPRISLPLRSVQWLVCAALAVGCSAEPVPGDGGDPSDPNGSSSGSSGGSSSGGGTEECPNVGEGSVALSWTGLPDDVGGSVTLIDPLGAEHTLSASGTRTGLPAGTYSVRAARVFDRDPIVRSVLHPHASEASFCLGDGSVHPLSVDYRTIATSGHLWSTARSRPDAQLIGFASHTLASSGEASDALVATGAPGEGAHAGRAIAFDRDGNLWSLGATTVDAPLLRFAGDEFASAGAKQPDRKLTPKLAGCSPGLNALAFDRAGSLWLAEGCADRVLVVAPVRLETSAQYTPAASDYLTGMHGPRSLALAADGAMWVADSRQLLRFAAPADGQARARTPSHRVQPLFADGGGAPPSALAFDGEGNLWLSSFGSNRLLKLPASALSDAAAAESEVTAAVTITLPVDALVSALAFDESGGLWVTLEADRIARLSPAQLSVSSDAGAATVPERILSHAALGSADGLAFFPAAAKLPLFSRGD